MHFKISACKRKHLKDQFETYFNFARCANFPIEYQKKLITNP